MQPAANNPDRGAFYIPSLDGIRALSFLLVFAAHAGVSRAPGGFGVTVFFFLSGYLITTLLCMEQDKSGRVSLGRFYMRRVLRILPSFYIVLALAVLAAEVGLLPGGYDGRALSAQALHWANYWVVLHGYDGMPAGTGVYWSLAVEEHFYLVFPVVFLALRRWLPKPRSQALALWALCGVVLVWRCVLVYGLGAAPDRTYVASDTRIDSILFGCALAVFGNPALSAASPKAETVYKHVLLPGALLVLLSTFLIRTPELRESVRYTLQGIALIPLFVVAIRYPTWGPVRLLNLRAVSFVGVLSYPLYLVHHVVLSALSTWLDVGVLRALFALIVSTAISWALYAWVEKPSARLRRWLSRPRVSPARSEAPALVVSLAEARDR